jgi:hypothetical protein
MGFVEFVVGFAGDTYASRGNRVKLLEEFDKDLR